MQLLSYVANFVFKISSASIFCYHYKIRSRDSSVGIVTRLQDARLKNRSTPGKCNLETITGAHPPSYVMGTGCYFGN
jgi:hypothetical protein